MATLAICQFMCGGVPYDVHESLDGSLWFWHPGHGQRTVCSGGEEACQWVAEHAVPGSVNPRYQMHGEWKRKPLDWRKGQRGARYVDKLDFCGY